MQPEAQKGALKDLCGMSSGASGKPGPSQGMVGRGRREDLVPCCAFGEKEGVGRWMERWKSSQKAKCEAWERDWESREGEGETTGRVKGRRGREMGTEREKDTKREGGRGEGRKDNKETRDIRKTKGHTVAQLVASSGCSASLAKQTACSCSIRGLRSFCSKKQIVSLLKERHRIPVANSWQCTFPLSPTLLTPITLGFLLSQENKYLRCWAYLQSTGLGRPYSLDIPTRKTRGLHWLGVILGCVCRRWGQGRNPFIMWSLLVTKMETDNHRTQHDRYLETVTQPRECPNGQAAVPHHRVSCSMTCFSKIPSSPASSPGKMTRTLVSPGD